MDIILATNNKHKVSEIKKILNFTNNRILTLAEVNFVEDMIEDGNSYYENAQIKVNAVRNRIKDGIILADDSGIEIDFLKGAPGLHSSRFMPELTQKQKNNEIVENMKNVKFEARGARFISVVCCSMPNGQSHFFKGTCEGHIASAIEGEDGFGFDPIFVPGGFDTTFGVLSSDVKNCISHRALSFLSTKNFIVKSGILQ